MAVGSRLFKVVEAVGGSTLFKVVEAVGGNTLFKVVEAVGDGPAVGSFPTASLSACVSYVLKQALMTCLNRLTDTLVA